MILFYDSMRLICMFPQAYSQGQERQRICFVNANEICIAEMNKDRNAFAPFFFELFSAACHHMPNIPFPLFSRCLPGWLNLVPCLPASSSRRHVFGTAVHLSFVAQGHPRTVYICLRPRPLLLPPEKMPLSRREWVLWKKEQLRSKGKRTANNSKYTARKRKERF